MVWASWGAATLVDMSSFDKELHMSMSEPAYFSAFKNFEFSRTPSGVLTQVGMALEGLTAADLAYRQG